MVKKITRAMACLLVCALALLPVGLHVNAVSGDLRIEQVQVEMPEVTAWFFVQDDTGDTIKMAASLDGKPLEAGEVRRFDSQTDPTHYFFLVDCSTSTTAAQMQAVRAVLSSFADSKGPLDTATLITFGTEVEVLLDNATDGADIHIVSEELAPNQPGTLFFDALAKAIDLAGEPEHASQRKVAFVFSDSVDYNLGGYTKGEIDKMLEATGLPFYALGFDTGTKEGLDNFGAIARASGGTISIVNAETLPQTVADLRQAIEYDTYVAKFAAQSNIITGTPQVFSLTIAETGRSANMPVPVKYWIPDTEAPTVASARQEGEGVALRFSEAVAGAESAESYVVKNATGELEVVATAAYDSEFLTATLRLSGVASGTLTIECPGVHDVSAEANPVSGSVTVEYTAAAAESEPQPAPQPEPEPGVPVGAWIAVALVLAAIIIAIAIVAARRRKAAGEQVTAEAAGDIAFDPRRVEQELPVGGEVQVHFAEAPLPIIRLDVTSATGESRKVELPINQTLFVGRSDICDVYFDDPQMSRQHFVIEEKAGQYTLTNLSQGGITRLNGVPIANPRPLHDGDTIEAGRERLVFRTVKTL